MFTSYNFAVYDFQYATALTYALVDVDAMPLCQLLYELIVLTVINVIFNIFLNFDHIMCLKTYVYINFLT